MNKTVTDFLNEVSNVDFQRFDSAKKHIKNGDAFESCVREDINNGIAYGASNFLLLNFHHPVSGKDYLVVAHDGEPFDDAMDVAKAGRFNMGKELGAQNSGIPATGLLLNSSVKNTEYGIFSKTKNDDDVGIMCKYIADTQFKQFDETDSLKEILETIFDDEYEKYNVFYIRSYNSNVVNKTTGSGKKSPLICNDVNCHSLSQICNYYDASIYYVEEYIDTIRPFGKRNKTRSQDDLENFVVKTHKFNVKNVEYVDNTFNEKKKYKFDATVEIDILPNIRTNHDGNNSSELLTKKYNTNFSRKVFLKTFRKFDTYTYQDFKHSVDKTARLVNEPIMFSSYSPIYLEQLGVEAIGNYKFTGEEIAESEDLQLVLDDYWEKEHSLDYSNYNCKPSTIIRVHIKNVKDFSLIGSIDNTFSTNEPRRIHEIQKKIFEKISIDGSDELISFKRYMSKLISKANINKFLPCDINTVTSQNMEAELIMTEEAMKMKKAFSPDLDCLPNKVGKKVGTLPIDAPTIPLKIKSLITGDYFESDNVKCTFEGVTFNHTGNGNYNVTVSGLYHYENDNKTKKIYHSVNEHKFGKNFFPKKNANNLNIDGKFYAINFNTDIPITVVKPPKIHDTDDDGVVDLSDKSGESYDRNSFYRKYDNQDLLCKFNMSTNTLLLNTQNLLIKKLSYNKPNDAKKLWSRVYKSFYDNVVKPIYYSYDNPVDKYDLKGNQHKLNETQVSDEKEAILNFLLKQYISNDPDCDKLMGIEFTLVEDVLSELSDSLD